MILDSWLCLTCELSRSRVWSHQKSTKSFHFMIIFSRKFSYIRKLWMVNFSIITLNITNWYRTVVSFCHILFILRVWWNLFRYVYSAVEIDLTYIRIYVRYVRFSKWYKISFHRELYISGTVYRVTCFA